MIRVGIDIGGAFTDVVVYNEENGEISWAKVETTPDDPSNGVLEAIDEAKVNLGYVNTIIHGQTLAINTIVERKGAKVGLITTKGFRDILEIQRANRRDMYNFRYKKPTPFVPRYLRLEVTERIKSNGDILTSLNENEVVEAIKKLKAENVEAIAVSFINSYVNPIHELKVGEIIKRVDPNIIVTLSHEVTREWREYERTSTAVLNAYVMPKMSKYLSKLENEFKNRGFKGNYFAMLSNGGMATFDYAKRFPIYTLESGPVAGVIGAIKISDILGEKNIIAMDGGSTTTKASLVRNLEPNINTDYYVGRDKYNPGYPVKVPTLDIVEIGNGGTSIARIDETSNLKVGPRAAGAYPGPVAYGKGGKDVTVTDAYIVCGFLNQEELLGGKIKVNKRLAEEAISNIAKYYNMSIEEVSYGIVKIANDNAVNAVRLISVQRGYDPREFTLVAYGGSGPMFAPFVAEELDIKKIIVPFLPAGVFSAWGMLVSDIRHDLVLSYPLRIDKESSVDLINEKFNELESKIRSILISEGFKEKDIIMLRYAEMRYYGQEHTVKVSVMPGEIGNRELEEIERRFHEAHEIAYAFTLDSPIEIVNFHVSGIVKAKTIVLKRIERDNSSIDKALVGKRKVFYDGKYEEWNVYNKEYLPINYQIVGPAIIEDPTSTSLVLEGQTGMLDSYGNLIIERD
ncbi:hydantoinase/oxoprolinase family protein [Saccharolobus solfataricus]|uniref:N-methylhydantoinase A (HuyA-1) n=3 Tax=Saccharolobus solfataricus TaxID=2287 RepID=Q97XP8_SACS2|nr:hydantoinase/oxoprolinase family protein [Saccharolobus solfataricus]AAK41875.1 N-methylhydantoinase A (huyA-1) [Saccharolobus solfataricus P2]AKA74608.1 hydantoinase/oxoprolinase family protein [Saccharolobus solfataricus]AKA77304.1 hydantoinase/oxoprolinase family protein [Saccharolobus solfataricus]AKA79995.1 hydantoinase/oxoprolinase family protein [Saccharolobus solfataricus]AZF69077.1 hydantoinase/oxoprolinase family protein [Saccharolobus solfataricus]